jgi:cytochrome c oxidase assembly protein subunit 15
MTDKIQQGKITEEGPGGRPRDTYRAVAIWLWSLAALVFLMVMVGGVTRLTESGLSITQWKPVTGVLPPWSEADWQAEFESYKQIPQYAAIFPNMDVAGFKFIYFWEWLHRLLGRLIGVATVLPLAYFWLRGGLPRGFEVKLLAVLALGALQGVVGWWMVASGLTERIEVAQERLAIHLVLAAVTFAALVWLAASLSRRKPELSGHAVPMLQWLAFGAVLGLILQIGLGALVAGLRAGRAYNTWPLIDGAFIPPLDDLAMLEPVWLNLVDNVLTVQFLHRMVGYGLVALVVVQVPLAARLAGGSRAYRRSVVLAGLVVLQVAIGVVTLLLAVPLWAGLLHQAFAMMILGHAVAHAQALTVSR